jgi:hypothetical protein
MEGSGFIRLINTELKLVSRLVFSTLKNSIILENYSQYQGDSFAAAIKDGYNLLKRHEVDSEESKFSWKIHAKKRKRSSQLPKKDRIYFGTNLDFSGEKFGAQVVVISLIFISIYFFRSFKNFRHFADFLTKLIFCLIWDTI